MPTLGVRRDQAALSSGRQVPPGETLANAIVQDRAPAWKSVVLVPKGGIALTQ